MADRRDGVTGVAVVLLLGAFAGSSFAQTVIDACYVRATGTVYRINAPGVFRTACRSADRPMPWTDCAGALRTGSAAGGDLSGTLPNPQVVGLRGRQIDATVPADGQVLRFDQAANAWKPATPASGVTDHGQLTGLGDDDHTQYLLASGARASVDGFAVTGTIGSGFLPATGAGTRLLWFPGRAALRAGNVTQSDPTAWDLPNIGLGSLAVGSDVRASGDHSQALGATAIASGIFSRAFGMATPASGDYSTAIGPNATASGNAATAIGFQAIASGANSMALGQEVTASGATSTALGFHASSNGQEGSFVYGDHTFAGDVTATAPNQFVVRAS